MEDFPESHESRESTTTGGVCYMCYVLQRSGVWLWECFGVASTSGGFIVLSDCLLLHVRFWLAAKDGIVGGLHLRSAKSLDLS